MKSESRIEDYMMASPEAAIYLETTEKALIDTALKWGLDIVSEDETLPKVNLFFPQQVHDLKMKMLKSRPLITAKELAQLIKNPNNLL